MKFLFFEFSSDKQSSTSDSYDDEMERLTMYDDSGNLMKFKVNEEAWTGIVRIGERAHRDRNFKMADVDLSEFGLITTEVKINISAETLLENSRRNLAALINATSSDLSTSGYSSLRSVDSNISSSSLPTAPLRM